MPCHIVHISLTAKDTPARLTEQPPVVFEATRPETAAITVDPRKRFQKMEGFGGAFTEAAAVTWQKLPAEKQAEVMRAYFDRDNGLGYTMGRTHINSCDFALGNYAHDEVDGDFSLEHFSIDRDRAAILPMLKEALRLSGGLKLFASPWSPPAWMKTNRQMNGGGRLLPECRDVWARYYCRYIREYEKEGIPFWGLTVQNEPEASQSWDSCLYSAEEERDFVRDYLGPTLRKEGLGHLNLMIWDHNRDAIYERARVVYDDPEAAQYVWGAAFHWYVGDHFDNLSAVHEAFPDKHLLFSEGCQEGGPHTGEWGVGERYGRSLINDLNRWTVAWVDWNLMLDASGGPNHVGNYCSAPILADTRAGQPLYQSSFYYLGHFSRYIRPGAERILHATTTDDLETTAFLNPEGTIAVVVMNRTEQAIPFALQCHDRAARTISPPHSIMTLRFADFSG
ncbi:MAG: glucosylceramidase [Proteobacteria bacterium]|nr:glucosylceramidase [Pseudomonadota bacterium]MBU1547420.1 glucosylceramidase [Pseudomonadota bacterium]MBU2620477.1 glucosylceramidase [Pseudomonadota bacterium]